MKTRILLPSILIASLLTPSAWAEQTSNNIPTMDFIRKSKSGICHTPDSPYYRRLKGYITYNSMQECRLSGGRPLGAETKEDPSAATPLPPCDPRQPKPEAQE